jgi:hypothetical protein
MDDDREWQFYFTKIDGEPGSIYFSEDVASRAPIADHAALIYLRLFMSNPRSDGLSSSEEFETLTKIEDVLQEALAIIGAIYVGRATYSGRRDFFYYASDGDKAVEAAAAAMEKFPDYRIELAVGTTLIGRPTATIFSQATETGSASRTERCVRAWKSLGTH